MRIDRTLALKVLSWRGYFPCFNPLRYRTVCKLFKLDRWLRWCDVLFLDNELLLVTILEILNISQIAHLCWTNVGPTCHPLAQSLEFVVGPTSCYLDPRICKVRPKVGSSFTLDNAASTGKMTLGLPLIPTLAKSHCVIGDYYNTPECV